MYHSTCTKPLICCAVGSFAVVCRLSDAGIESYACSILPLDMITGFPSSEIVNIELAAECCRCCDAVQVLLCTDFNPSMHGQNSLQGLQGPNFPTAISMCMC